MIGRPIGRPIFNTWNIMDIIIKKAKLARSGTVEASYTDSEGNEISLKGKNKGHNDLRDAFAALVPFFADLTEQKEADTIDWDCLESADNAELLKKIDVTGITISNGNIVTLTGRRTLCTSRILCLNSPCVEMDSETFEWDHVGEFDLVVQNVIEEVRAYLEDRKWEVRQSEIEFGDDPDDPFAAADPTVSAPPIDPVNDVA